jgi:hypothetical protein
MGGFGFSRKDAWGARIPSEISGSHILPPEGGSHPTTLALQVIVLGPSLDGAAVWSGRRLLRNEGRYAEHEGSLRGGRTESFPLTRCRASWAVATAIERSIFT